MKRFRGSVAFLIVLCSVVATSGCLMVHDAYVGGSGTIATESREVGVFNRVESSGSADMTIRVGEPPSVTIETDDNLLPMIETRVSNEVLIVSQKGSLHTQHGIKVLVTTPSLAGVTINGSGDVEISDMRGSSLEFIVRGSGEIRAAGEADSVNVAIQGSGDVDLGQLVSRTAAASIAGSGDIRLHVTEELDASIAGSGDIHYAGGAPTVRQSVAGSGEVRPF